MFSPALDSAAREVTGQFPTIRAGRLIPLGNRGGFSGARIWQVETAAGLFCLRAWPTDGPGEERLRWIHQLMRRACDAGLALVPAVIETTSGKTVVTEAGRLWDVSTWLPGIAAFSEQPSPRRLAAACTALAHLHRAWADCNPGTGPCPAVARRLQAHDEWMRLLRSGWQTALSDDALDPVAPWARRAWDSVRRHQDRIPQRLAPWVDRPVLLHPCLCDIWHDHVLFDGNTLTGIIDYGSVKVDHVAVDLARMLGSMAGEDAGLRAAGLDAYGKVRQLSAEEEGLVSALDETGTILGAANWLRWLYHDGRQYEDRLAVARRLAKLVERIERWR